MNNIELFAKTSNFHFQQQLQHTDRLFLLSRAEKRWLKTLLVNKTAPFLSAELAATLLRRLEAYRPLPTSHLVEKNASPTPQPSPWLEFLHQALRTCTSLTLKIADSTYTALPCRLEYSHLDGHWQLLWLDKTDATFHLTRLTEICSCQSSTAASPPSATALKAWEQQQQRTAILTLQPDSYEERRRLLNALACFPHKIQRNHTYQIHLDYRLQDEPLLLKKLCELGRKVQIQEPRHLQTKLKEIASAALYRYQKQECKEKSGDKR